MPMQDSKSHEEVQAAYENLVARVRTGVLLTLKDGHPFGSHVPYLLGADWSCVYLHLSRLALHTQHLLHDPRISLFIAEPDEPNKNPTALQRLNLQGTAGMLPATHESYESVKQRYLAKFPQSKMTFGFGDFALWALRMREAHLVLGFGQAYHASAAASMQWHQQAPEKKA
ncbi:MAG: pyridoxamine 5'-phosphate oxidase family protein [Nitrospira sp.]|nr:pyridoxamine 5'-phosphate oxidase family protein [Nitrospira sp.]